MTDKHTPEPWHVRYGIEFHQIESGKEGQTPLVVATLDNATEAQVEMLEHACACVNGCAGLNPEGIVALVKAAEAAVDQMELVGRIMEEDHYEGSFKDWPEMLALRAALAGVKGGE